MRRGCARGFSPVRGFLPTATMRRRGSDGDGGGYGLSDFRMRATVDFEMFRRSAIWR